VRALLTKLVIAATALSSSGCAVLASANAAHSRISPCVDEMGFSVADLVLAAAATGILAGSGALDESPAWMLLPGVFVSSGVIGSIYVHKCRGDLHKQREAMPMPVYEPVIDTPTSTLPDATPEELGLPPSAVVAPDPRLQLSPDSALKEEPGKPRPSDDLAQQKIMCGVDLPSTCPAGTSCAVIAEGRGTCAPDRQPKPSPDGSSDKPRE
jgi:hypothetical protein